MCILLFHFKVSYMDKVSLINTCLAVYFVWNEWFCGVVVITSALHAEGREFEPRQNLYIILKDKIKISFIISNINRLYILSQLCSINILK